MSIGHKSLIFAAKTTAGSVLDLITEPEFLRKVQDEFKERMRRRTYKLPIPRDTPIPLDLAKAQAEILMKGS